MIGIMEFHRTKKNKDVIHRIHKDLIPYCDLEESEKEKDRDNIRMLQVLFDYS